MSRTKTLEERIAYRIDRGNKEVFLRNDFGDLGGYDQIGRGLRQLVAKGKIVKIGYGLYAKAKTSSLSGRAIPRKGLPELAVEALQRLKVEVVPSSYELAYNEGRTTQIPTGRVIAVKDRVSRRIGYDGKYVTFEHST